MKASELNVTINTKKAWWFEPLTRTMWKLMTLRVIPPSFMVGALNRMVPLAFHYRIGKGKWMRTFNRREFEISIEER